MLVDNYNMVSADSETISFISVVTQPGIGATGTYCSRKRGRRKATGEVAIQREEEVHLGTLGATGLSPIAKEMKKESLIYIDFFLDI